MATTWSNSDSLNVSFGTQSSSVQTNRVSGAPALISKTASWTVDRADAGKTFVLNAAAGLTATLPAAVGSGLSWKFLVGTTITSNSAVIKVASASDEFRGNVYTAADGGATVVAYEVADNDDTITMDGSTKGGIQGDWFEIVDLASGYFYVRGLCSATGTEATPFSATVS